MTTSNPRVTMSPIRVVGLVVLLLAAGGVLMLCGMLLLDWIAGDTPDFRSSFDRVEEGMPRAEVVKTLGKPDRESDEFRLGQYEGYEEEYARAEGSDSEYYCLWFRGIDHTYTVGFDGDDRVTMKASGGT